MEWKRELNADLFSETVSTSTDALSSSHDTCLRASTHYKYRIHFERATDDPHIAE